MELFVPVFRRILVEGEKLGLIVNAAGASDLPMPDLKKALQTKADLAKQKQPKVKPVFSSLLENYNKDDFNSARKDKEDSLNSIKHMDMDDPQTVELLTEIAESSKRNSHENKQMHSHEQFTEKRSDQDYYRTKRQSKNAVVRSNEAFRTDSDYYDDENDFEEKTLKFDRNSRIPKKLRKKGLQFSSYNFQKERHKDSNKDTKDLKEFIEADSKFDHELVYLDDAEINDKDDNNVKDSSGLSYTLDDIKLTYKGKNGKQSKKSE